MSEEDTGIEGFDEDVGLGSEDRKYAKSNREEWFKGEKGRSYRVAMLYFHPLDISITKALKAKNGSVTREQVTEAMAKVLAKRCEGGKTVDQLAPHDKLDLTNVRFKKVEAHYKDGVGFVLSRLGKDGADADTVWKMLGDMKRYFTTVLLVYPTNKEGEVIKEQLAHNWSVIPWRFGNKVFERLLQVGDGLRANDLSIASQDLMLKCSNADYQNFDIDGAGKSLWRMNEKFQSQVLEKAMSLYDKLVPFREISTADLRIKLGLSSGNAGEDISDSGFEGLLDQV